MPVLAPVRRFAECASSTVVTVAPQVRCAIMNGAEPGVAPHCLPLDCEERSV